MCYPYEKQSRAGKGCTRSYVSGFNRYKHCGKTPAAQILFDRGYEMFVGKCPKTLSHQVAQDLLTDGIEQKSIRKSQPVALWNVHEGVVYKAEPNNVGQEWHGYPTCEKSEKGGIPIKIRKELLKRAEQKGMLRDTERWLDQGLTK